MSKLKHLLLIDPQVDFADPGGALSVPGADQDMERTAQLIGRLGTTLTDIHVSLDSHTIVHIAHPCFWINENGDHPTPFSTISVKDVESGVWKTTRAMDQTNGLFYLRALEKSGKFQHMIWPPHCLLGSPGHAVSPTVYRALLSWVQVNMNDRSNKFPSQSSDVNWIQKGSNPYTEHFSAVQAEVPDPNDQATQKNKNLIISCKVASQVLVAGIAGSHCVANTVRDLINDPGLSNQAGKFIILIDLMSPVPGCEQLQADFLKEMETRGMRLMTSDKYV